MKAIVILMLLCCGNAGAEWGPEITSNGGFETGSPVPTSWTAGGEVSVIDTTAAYSGSKAVRFVGGGPLGSLTRELYQSNAGIVLGKVYVFSFVAKRVSGSGQLFSGNIVNIYHTLSSAADWTRVEYRVTAINWAYIAFSATSGSRWLIDDVSVRQYFNPVPEVIFGQSRQ